MNVMDKNDSPPKFYELPPAIEVSEDLGAGHAIATIRAMDPDTIGSLSFSLVDGDVDNKFDLEQETGVLRLRDTLDREAKDVYRLTMRVSDGVQSTDTTVNIQVNLLSPSLKYNNCNSNGAPCSLNIKSRRRKSGRLSMSVGVGRFVAVD